MVLILDVKVVPSSGRIGCKREEKYLKCYLKSAPEKGKANQELLKYFSKKLGLPIGKIVLIAGAKSRKKRLRIDTDLSYDMLCTMLGIEIQIKLFT